MVTTSERQPGRGKAGAIVAARTGSSRLPGKALLPLKGLPMIVFLLRRLRGSRRADEIIFATTTLREDDDLAAMVAAEGVSVFRGAHEDVVGRYVAAAAAHGLDTVVRVTGDCPFVDAETLDYCVERCGDLGSFDLATTKSRFPVGIDFEIYPAMGMAHLHTDCLLSAADREHLTLYMYEHPDAFAIRHIDPLPRWHCPGTSFTVDTPADYRAAQRWVEEFADVYFSVAELVELACDAH